MQTFPLYGANVIKNNNVFKKELSQYLTANCRSNLGEKPEDKTGIKDYTVNSCQLEKEEKEPLQIYKEKAASILYEEDN